MTEGEVNPTRRRIARIANVTTQVLLATFLVLIVLIYIEGSVGHDGLLCELGWDSDGEGDITSGCGGMWD